MTLSRNTVESHAAAVVCFETPFAIKALFWAKTWGHWFAIDPKEDLNTHSGGLKLSRVYMSRLSAAFVDLYFSGSSKATLVATNVSLDNGDSLIEPKWALQDDVQVFFPTANEELPQGLRTYIAGLSTTNLPAIWATSLPFGTVLRRKVAEDYLYIVHVPVAVNQQSSFEIYQTLSDNTDVAALKKSSSSATCYLGSWSEVARVPSSFALRIFDAFGWPTHDVGEIEVNPRYTTTQNKRWTKLPITKVFGSAYPKRAPQPGVSWIFKESVWTVNGGSLTFGAGSVHVKNLPWLFQQLVELGGISTASGEVRVPYTQDMCDMVDRFLELEASTEGADDVIKATLKQKSIRLVPFGWNLQVVRHADVGTCFHIRFSEVSQGYYVKLDDNLWYSDYSDSWIAFEAISEAVNSALSSDAAARVCSQEEQAAKCPKVIETWNTYKTDLDVSLPKAQKAAPGTLVHWDELAAENVPYWFVNTVNDLHTTPNPNTAPHLGPWWLPPPGVVYRLHHDKGTAYLLLGVNPDLPVISANGCLGNLASVVSKVDGEWTSLCDVPLNQALSSITGKPVTTLEEVKSLLRLHTFDYRRYPSIHTLYSHVKRRGERYERCNYTAHECFRTGGRGHRFHPVNFVHPVMTNNSVQALPQAVKDLKELVHKVPNKPWTTKKILTRTSREGVHYLLMSEDAIHILDSAGEPVRKFTLDFIDKKEGVYKDFELADWGLNWCSDPVWYEAGSYLPDAPDSVRRVALKYGKHSSIQHVDYLKAHPGDVLVQRRSSGKVYGVVTNTSIFSYDETGTQLEEMYRFGGGFSSSHSSGQANQVFQSWWGVNLAHLKRQPALLPTTLVDGPVLSSSIPACYEELRSNLQKQCGSPPFPFVPEPGTVIFRREFEHAGSKHTNVVLQFTSTHFQVIDLFGIIHHNVLMNDTTAAYILCLGLGVTASPDPETVGTTSTGLKQEIFAPSKAPVGLMPDIYNAVFAKTYKGTTAPGLPALGQLHRITTVKGSVDYLFNAGTRVLLFQDGIKMVVYLDDVSKQEADLLAAYGVTVTVNSTTSTEVPSIILHEPGEYPNPDHLEDTGDKLSGSYFKHSVLKDKDGNLWLWKQLAEKYHRFVVDAEECGSRIAYMLLGSKSVCAQRTTRGGNLGTIQPLLPTGSTLIGRDTPPTKLTQSQLIQLLQQHPVAWLISDHDAHGDQFMITPDGFVVALDKGQAFKHFNDQEKLSLSYFPNDDSGQKGPYVYLVYELLKMGKLDMDEALDAIAQSVVRIKFADDAVLMPIVSKLAKQRFGETPEGEAFVQRFLKRKTNIDKEFDAFLSEVLGKAVSLRHYAKELKLANIQDIVFTFPTMDATEVQYETIAAEYHDVEYKTKHDSIAVKHGIKVAGHNKKDYLVCLMHNEKSALTAFLEETKLKPIGNETDQSGKPSGGYKKTQFGWMIVIHRLSYENGAQVEVKKEIKTHAKTQVKAVHAKGELPPTTLVVELEKGKTPIQIVDYVPLQYAFKGKNHNYEDISVIAQVPKFPRGGANIFLGSPYVTNNYMNLTKVRIKDRFYYEISLRVDQILLNGLSSAGLKTATYQFNSRDYLPEKGVYEESPHSKGAMAYANFKSHYKCFDDDVEVWLFNDDCSEKFAMQGTITVRIPVSRFNTGARMDKVLRTILDEFKVSGKNIHIDSLGQLITPPTDESLARITLMKASFSRLPWETRTGIDMYSPKANDLMIKALAKHGCNVDDLELAYLAEGHASTVHKNSGKKLFSELSSIRTITHGGSVDNVASVLKHGLLSPVERSKRGVMGHGIVNSRDFLTGGAEMIMTALGHMSHYAAHDRNVCYLISPNQLSRTDLYFHNSDQYGSVNPSVSSHLRSNPSVFDIIRKSSSGWSGSNELIFWHSIPVTAILGVFCDPGKHASIVAELKAANIHTVNGQPVSTFVHAHKKYDVMTEITSNVVKAL